MSKLEKFLTPEQVKLCCDNERDFVLNDQFKNILKQNMKDIVSHFKYEYHKTVWEKSLGERTSDMQKEIEILRAENARYREALKHISADGENVPECCYEHSTTKTLSTHFDKVAREALKGGE